MKDDDEPITISVNGVDNVGKTTHLRWLSRTTTAARSLGTVDRWHPRWQQVAAGDFARWWFEESTTAEHVDLVFGSHQQRRLASGRLALEDRGAPMLLAMCAATAVVKDGCAPLQALELVTRRAACFPARPRREVHVLLRHHDYSPREEAEAALRRDPDPPSLWYREYQRALAEVLEHQRQQGVYDITLVRGNRPIVPVQHELRKRLASRGLRVRGLPSDLPQHVWILGGLSECGKSTVGELLRDEHGTTRLKIDYLLGVAAARVHVDDPYTAWSESEQAEQLVEELLRLSASCHCSRVSLESAHRFAATQHTKRLLGERCHIVYIHADKTARRGRAHEETTNLEERDRTKIQRGAEHIAAIADHVIDNDRSLAALKLSLTRLVTETTQSRRDPLPWTPRTNKAWLAAVTRQLVDEQVALVLATGSTGRQHWQPECSDFDLLVVRDDLPTEWLRQAWNGLRTTTDTHVGLSCFTTTELHAGVLPPRVVHALRMAADGTGVLHRRNGFHVPVPAHDADDRISRGELGVVLMTTRRLLAAAEPNMRELRKHLVLLAKILLRADGHDAETDVEVLTAVRHHHSTLDLDIPPPDELRDATTGGRTGQRVVTATQRLLTYCDQLHQPGKDPLP